MDNNLVQILNNIPLGYTIVVIAGIVACTAWVTKTMSNVLTKHRNKVLREYDESETRDEMMSSLDQLQESISDIKKDVEKVTDVCNKNATENKERLTALEQKFDTFKKSSDKQDQSLMESMGGLEKNINSVSDQVRLLVGSDKEAIEMYISDEYHKWMERQEIDFMALETIERRLSQYKMVHPDEEWWVEHLVKDLRELPKRRIIDSLD